MRHKGCGGRIVPANANTRTATEDERHVCLGCGEQIEDVEMQGEYDPAEDGDDKDEQ